MVTSLLAAHLEAVLIALLCLGSLGIVAIAARLRVTLTAEQDYVMQPPEAESPLEQLGDLPTVAEEMGPLPADGVTISRRDFDAEESVAR
jgi:hypothetical protein